MQIPEAEHINQQVIGEVPVLETLYQGIYSEAIGHEISIDTKIHYEEYNLTRLTNGDIWESRIGMSSGNTLGYGLYLTHYDQAIRYAQLRGKAEGTIPAIHSIEINPDARFFDFRHEKSLEENAHVPLKIALQWQEYFHRHISDLKHYYTSTYHTTKELTDQSIFALNIEKYESHLNDFIERLRIGKIIAANEATQEGQFAYGRGIGVSRNLNLRDMLRTMEEDNDAMIEFGGLWAKFVMDTKEHGGLECDGIVYIEGGDTEEFPEAPSYVLYNLKQIRNQSTQVLKAHL